MHVSTNTENIQFLIITLLTYRAYSIGFHRTTSFQNVCNTLHKFDMKEVEERAMTT